MQLPSKTCPLDGKCLQSAVIYEARVTRKDNNKHETYIGLPKNYFKTFGISICNTGTRISYFISQMVKLLP